MKVSVIIPVYNTQDYLDQCLDSVQGQTLKDIEIICVDDGSTDSSLDILRHRESKDERMTVLTQPNSRAGVARNNGIRIAKGEYLCFLDSDDFYDVEMLEKMYNQAKKVDADLCACTGRFYHQDTGEFSPWRCLTKHLTPKREVFRACELGQDAFRFVFSGPPNKIIKRSLVMEHQLEYQPIRTVNDLYFINMCVALAQRITVVTDKPMAVYRVGLSTNVQSAVPKSPLDCVAAGTALKEGMIREKLYPKMKAGYDNFIAFEIERYTVKLSPFPEAFEQLHNWYHTVGRGIYDIAIGSLDAGTLSNLMMTFEGVSFDMTSEQVRKLVIANKEKYKALYGGHKKERARFLLGQLVKLEGAPKGFFRWLSLILNDVRKKLCNRR